MKAFSAVCLFISLGSIAGAFLQNAPDFPVRQPVTLVVEGRREPAEASVSTKAMKYLPFTVPEGVTRITIHKEFDHGSDPKQRNTVDFGLFDPQGVGYGGKGFRGWQGGVPDDFTIAGTIDACSPHAIPGPLPSGRWQIAQYFLKSTPDGLKYRYTITFHFDGVPAPKQPVAVPEYRPGVIRDRVAWYAGNLHAHTIHSDGGRTLEDLVVRNETSGFDFLASTEHNSTTAHYRFADVAKKHPNHLLLFGDEFTSPSGHANIIGQQPGRFFDFRMDAGDGKLPKVISEAHRQKAVFVVNHPFAPCTSCPWLYPESEWTDADAIEVWNGVWTGDDRKAVDLWDRLLKQGRKIHAFGGTDYHRGEDAMVPVSRVFASELSRDAILDGLRRGHVFISESPNGAQLYLTPETGKELPGHSINVKTGETFTAKVRVVNGEGASLRIIHAAGEETQAVQRTDTEIRVRVPISAAGKPGYVRAELTDSLGRMLALTNPLYLRPR